MILRLLKKLWTFFQSSRYVVCNGPGTYYFEHRGPVDVDPADFQPRDDV